MISKDVGILRGGHCLTSEKAISNEGIVRILAISKELYFKDNQR
jgi:hypothetical protein